MIRIGLLILLLNLTLADRLVGGFEKHGDESCASALHSYLTQNNLNLGNYKVKNCSTQVVAGINYQMDVQTENGDCSITIYRDLSNAYSVHTGFKDSCSALTVATSYR